MRKLIAVMALCACTTVAFAQWGEEELPEKPKFRDRIFVGGGLGSVGLSSNIVSFSVYPLVGVQITPRLSTGAQFTYRFAKYKYTSYPDITTNDYGINPFVRFKIFQTVFLQAEYEYLNYQIPDPTPPIETYRSTFSSYMAGGGFFQPIGRRAGIFFVALYNFAYDQVNSPYASPLVIRAGVTAGF